MMNMRYLFEPRSIAVIGAFHDTAKIGYTVLENIVLGGYPHEVYPINPQGGEILGLWVFRDLEEIDEPIDLAYIVIPAKFVFDAIMRQHGVLRAESLQDAFDWCNFAGSNHAGVKGAYITPDIGIFDYQDDGASNDEGNVTYFGTQWKINF